MCIRDSVSRGRTVREFLTAVLLVPSLVSVIWMSTFGGTALHQALGCLLYTSRCV